MNQVRPQAPVPPPSLPQNQRWILGLTGGIATGKSTVATYLTERYGWPVLDADLYARQAVAVGSAGLAAIATRYGADILQPDGQLNRRRLGEIIFQDPQEKTWLEQQIHPFVRQRFDQESQGYPPQQPLVYAIPLLFEAQLTGLVSTIWVVACDPDQQQQRLIQRDHLSPTQAQQRIDSQMPLADKCDQADVVLDNSCDRNALYRQIDHHIAKALGRSA